MVFTRLLSSVTKRILNFLGPLFFFSAAGAELAKGSFTISGFVPAGRVTVFLSFFLPNKRPPPALGLRSGFGLAAFSALGLRSGLGFSDLSAFGLRSGLGFAAFSALGLRSCLGFSALSDPGLCSALCLAAF